MRKRVELGGLVSYGSSLTDPFRRVAVDVDRILRSEKPGELASTFPRQRNAADERTVELADGGRIELRGDGTMVHLDASGKRVEMKDGEPMTAKDGTRVMMKSRALWRAIGDGDTPSARR